MRFLTIIMTLTFIGVAACGETESNSSQTENQEMELTQGQIKKYRVTFNSNWNASDHVSTPNNAHFSPIVVATHNANYDLLPVGGITNNNLEPVAELGDAKKLNDEIQGALITGNVGMTLNTTNMFINSAVQSSFEVEVSQDHPFLSLVSMIAPSPDWMVGLSNLKLYSEAQGFYPGVTDMPLYALDGGTESGDQAGNFSINNAATSPKQPINVLQGPGFDAPFAFVTITPIN